MRLLCLLMGGVLVTGGLHAQQFSSGQVLNGGGNASSSENIDFADVDLDGDLDAAVADGGDSGVDQNQLWLNQGPANLGAFSDQTATALPALMDRSRDVEFADIDADGDVDLYVANTGEGDRWWLNTGVGSGVYVDETNTRWVNLGVNNGVAFSSIDPVFLEPSGGFFDFCCDADFADLDNDGDLDLVHSSYGTSGNVPTRIFLNDSAGFFEEFNPSQFQLSGLGIANGNPGLWCEGVQASSTSDVAGIQCDIATFATDVDLGDIDGDFDIDILLGDRDKEPRMFLNGTTDNGLVNNTGPLSFRDVTKAAFPGGHATGGGHYEQELGDLDNDGDLDIYGLNWGQSSFDFTDQTLTNDGSGVFPVAVLVAGSGSDEEEADFIDYDLDGDMDVVVANFSGANKLYRNDLTGGSHSLVDVSQLLGGGNLTSRDVEVADVDKDGDYDVFMANNGPNGLNQGYINNLNPSSGKDGHAPRIPNLEQAADRTASMQPTVVRVQVYDNAPYYAVWYYGVFLRIQVDGGTPFLIQMRSSGGQVFRGEIPGDLVGTIC